MRLICPKCDAQYDVDASAIPQTGRDLQCSNCNHAWFFIPESEGADSASVVASATPSFVAPLVAPVASEPPIASAAQPLEKPEPLYPSASESGMSPLAESVRNAARSFRALAPSSETEFEDDEPQTATNLPPPRRALDENVLAVLREEAARELAARQTDAQALEVQGDLGLTAPHSTQPVLPPQTVTRLPQERPQQARPLQEPAQPEPPAPDLEDEAPMADLRDIHEDAPLRAGARRDLLPDIEEINSTLRPSDHASEPLSAAELAAARNNFGIGFGLMMLLALILAGLYYVAPYIAANIPSLGKVATGYMQFVDGLRLSLDQMIQQATGFLRSLTE